MKKPTVLIVDDEPRICEVLDLLLRREFTILTAATADEASAICACQLPDLVLSDVDMTDAGDGVFLAITLGHRYPKLPVLLMTGGNAVAAADVAGVPCLSKPIPSDVLRRAIRERLPRPNCMICGTFELTCECEP